MNPNPRSKPPEQDALREHEFDGIQEYDKRLPNWWLLTLYGGIAFAIGYWFYYERASLGPSNEAALAQEMSVIEARRLASAPAVDDASLWKMSRNAVFVDAGRVTFNSTCASCHTENLTGAIGPNLVDHKWIHGGRPTEIQALVEKGVLTKGMPSWGPVLGSRKISEVVAYILSHHQENEPIETEAEWKPRPAGG
jgi:cytochrome c oxidase cbb3-type subunit 3